MHSNANMMMDSNMTMINNIRLQHKQKEMIKQRRSILVYGTPNMKAKQYQLQNRKRKKPSKETDDKGSGNSNASGSRKKKKSFKDKLKWKSNNSFLNFWDGFMLAVITYSCFTSMYFAAIYFDICEDWIFWVENAITFFFTLDIIFRFLRL